MVTDKPSLTASVQGMGGRTAVVAKGCTLVINHSRGCHQKGGTEPQRGDQNWSISDLLFRTRTAEGTILRDSNF